MAEAELYSKNKLTNPGAETGDTSGWTVAGVAAVAGGKSGSYCFVAAGTSYIIQELTGLGTPPDFKVGMSFLPEYEPDPTDKEVHAYVLAEYEYADGTRDQFALPCRHEAPGLGV